VPTFKPLLLCVMVSVTAILSLSTTSHASEQPVFPPHREGKHVDKGAGKDAIGYFEVVIDDRDHYCENPEQGCHPDGDFFLEEMEAAGHWRTVGSERALRDQTRWADGRPRPNGGIEVGSWTARWTAVLPAAGSYWVDVFVPMADTSMAVSHAVDYTIVTSNASSVFRTIDHATGPAWRTLGEFEFQPNAVTGHDGPGEIVAVATVILESYIGDWQAGADKVVFADAVRIRRGTPPPLVVDSWLQDFPDDTHVRQGQVVRYCYSVSRELEISWRWFHPVDGWSDIFIGPGKEGCRNSNPLTAPGARVIRVEARDGGLLLGSDETSFFVDGPPSPTVPPPTAPPPSPTRTRTATRMPPATMTAAPTATEPPPPTSPPVQPSATRPATTRPPTSAVPTAQSQAPIAVFVHGFMGLTNQQWECEDKPFRYDASTPGDFTVVDASERSLLATGLHEKGYSVYFAHYRSGFLNTAPLEDSAACLEHQIRALRPQPTSPKITLLAHSLGGIVSRYYLDRQTYRGDVKTFITYGSPHLGLTNEIALLLAVVDPKNLGGVLLSWSTLHPGLAQAFPAGMRHYNSEHALRTTVDYSMIGGRPGRFAFSPLISGDDDGLITFDSATARSATFPARGNLRRWSVDDGHANVLFDLISDGYDQSQETLACINRVLQLAAVPPDVCSAVSVSNSQALDTRQMPDRALQSANQHQALSPLETGHLDARASKRVPLMVVGHRLQVLLGWTGQDIDVTLVTPSGARVGRGNVSVRFPGSSFRLHQAPGSAKLVAAYDIVNPPPGQWYVDLTATDEDGDYGLFAALESAVDFSVEEPEQTTPGGKVVIRAYVEEGGVAVPSASVTAELLVSEAAAPMALTRGGNGVFMGMLPAPARDGVYMVRVRAMGQSSEGAFNLEALRSIAVYTEAPRPIYLPLSLSRGQWEQSADLTPEPAPTATAVGAIGEDNAARLEVLSSFSEKNWVETVAFEPSGDVAAWGGRDGARVMDLLHGTPLQQITAHVGQVHDVAFGQRSSNLYTGGVDPDGGRVRIWDWSANRELQTFVCTEPGSGSHVTVSPSEDWLACGGGGTPRFQFWHRRGPVWERVQDSMPATIPVWLGADEVLFWNEGWFSMSLPDGSPSPQLPDTPKPSGVMSVTRNGSLVAIGSGTGIGVWRYPEGTRHLPPIELGVAVAGGSFSPNGEVLAVGDVQGTVRIWRGSDGKLLQTLTAHTQEVPALAFSADGTRMATVDLGGNVLIWHVPPSGALSRPLDGRRTRAAADQRRELGSAHATGRP